MKPSQSARISSGFTSTILEKMRFTVNDETRMWNDKGITKPQEFSSFEHLSLFRHSSLGFRHFLLVTRGEDFHLAFGRKAGAQFRLPILRQRFEPCERVARS